MTRTEKFVFRATPNDRELIAFLAARLQRSQSDAVRFVVLNAARQLSDTQGENQITEPTYHPAELSA